MRLTDIVLKSLPAPSAGQKTYADDTLPGFGVRVSQGGTKTFTLVHGLDRSRTTIGRYPVISLAAARDEAKRLLAERTLGKRQPRRITGEEALEVFVAEKTQKNRPRTIKTNEHLIRKHFGPVLKRQLSDVETHHITNVTDRLSRAPGTAIHVFWAVRTFLRWCVRRRYIQHSPIEGLDAPSRPVFRDRVLSDSELAAVLSAAPTRGIFGNMVVLLVLTGQRRGEIAELRAEWIDYTRQTITWPAWLCKNGREHRIPYGDRVAAVLETLPQQGLLFPAQNRDTPFTGFSKAKALLDTVCPLQPWTLHDLRRTFATGWQRLGVRIEVTEAMLNHISGSRAGIVGIYQRHTYVEEMRTAQVLWEKHIASLQRPE